MALIEEERRKVRHLSIALITLIIVGLIVGGVTKPLYYWVASHFLENIPTLVVSYQNEKVRNLFLVAGWLGLLLFIPPILALTWSRYLQHWQSHRWSMWLIYGFDTFLLAVMPIIFTMLFGHEWIRLLNKGGEIYLSNEYLAILRNILTTHYYYFAIASIPLLAHTFFLINPVILRRRTLIIVSLIALLLFIWISGEILPRFYHYNLLYSLVLVMMSIYLVITSRRLMLCRASKDKEERSASALK